MPCPFVAPETQVSSSSPSFASPVAAPLVICDVSGPRSCQQVPVSHWIGGGVVSDILGGVLVPASSLGLVLNLSLLGQSLRPYFICLFPVQWYQFHRTVL